MSERIAPWRTDRIRHYCSSGTYKTAIDQFMLTAVTGVAGGKNEKNTLRIRKMLEKAFTARPSLGPIFHGP